MSNPYSQTPQPAYDPAGWYPDPNNDALLRHWNGFSWGSETTPRNAVARRVRFFEAVILAFKGTFTYRGRSTPGEFWWWMLFNVVVSVALLLWLTAVTPSNALEAATKDPAVANAVGLLVFVWILASLVVQIPLMVRRLHDKAMSGWLVLLAFIPIGSLVLLVLLIGAGTPGPNRYGPVPTAMSPKRR